MITSIAPTWVRRHRGRSPATILEMVRRCAGASGTLGKRATCVFPATPIRTPRELHRNHGSFPSRDLDGNSVVPAAKRALFLPCQERHGFPRRRTFLRRTGEPTGRPFCVRAVRPHRQAPRLRKSTVSGRELDEQCTSRVAAGRLHEAASNLPAHETSQAFTASPSRS